MSAQPLTLHPSPASVIAHGPEGPVTAARYLGDVAQLASLLPRGRHIFNVCQDRYRFMVGLGAALVRGKTSLLPASRTASTVAELQVFAPDVYYLTDGPAVPGTLQRVDYPVDAAPAAGVWPPPEIPAQQEAVCLFTSGSTGKPVPQRKSWGALVRNGLAEARRLQLPQISCAIVATVPAQHSYGLESSVLLALLGGCAVYGGHPFYPLDIAQALDSVPAPRMLVTTPFHLRTLLDAEVTIPPLHMVLSATAPLSPELAARAESRLQTPVMEIYGCTESGQLASRRTTAGRAWQLLENVRLEREGDVHYACGGHVEGRIPLADVIEMTGPETFLLHGRTADLVNIAGKRTSLAFLNHQLLTLPGVTDGCFFMPAELDAGGGVTRLAAFAVAPGLGTRELLALLRERVDPIFLPRPLVLLEAMPRNSAGKLPRETLEGLLTRHPRTRREDT